ncbi:hypothetical protein ACFVT9_33755 [Kitasatospora cineracea]|uniref:hypothetical protein n=1 Tax=Kitasatospora cineracea TaxID=88074 RepID=UPI0036D7B1BB
MTHHHGDGPLRANLPVVHDLVSGDLMIPAAAVTALLRGIAECWRAHPVPDPVAALLDMAGRLELECMAVDLTFQQLPED